MHQKIACHVRLFFLDIPVDGNPKFIGKEMGNAAFRQSRVPGKICQSDLLENIPADIIPKLFKLKGLLLSFCQPPVYQFRKHGTGQLVDLVNLLHGRTGGQIKKQDVREIKGVVRRHPALTAVRENSVTAAMTI